MLRPDTASLLSNNRVFHRMLRDGVEVEYRRPDGSIAVRFQPVGLWSGSGLKRVPFIRGVLVLA